MDCCFAEKFKVIIDAPFKCDNPTFDFFEAALDCFNKAVELMTRWKHHNVKISLVKFHPGDDDWTVVLRTFIE